ncbi:hypothetical protein HYS50_02895 [Candidatus Woesearchaeota archaeon]|nr:hypothetical protein [Candidatus Woesearchaeota archaeon]
MKKSVVAGAAFFLFFFIAVAQISAIGISPARVEIAFEPNLHYTFTVSLLNSGEKPLNATLQLAGELAPYFKAEEGFFVLGPRSMKAYTIVANLPPVIKRPGNHRVSVHAVQAPLKTGAEIKGIGAVVSVEGDIIIKVPYPGKYAEAELEIEDVNEGETSTATIRVVNYGLEDIRRAAATLEIYDFEGLLLDTLTSPAILIPSRQSDIFTLTLDSSKYSPGIFPINAYVEYDAQKTDPISKELRIGTLFANITNYTHEVYTKKITLFDVYIHNRWNNKLENVYAEIQLFNQGVPMGQVLKTPSVEIQPWRQTVVSAFLDATVLEPGLYEVEITAYYHGKTTTVRGPLLVRKYFAISMTMILIGIILLMLIIDVVIWIAHRRKDDA